MFGAACCFYHPNHSTQSSDTSCVCVVLVLAPPPPPPPTTRPLPPTTPSIGCSHPGTYSSLPFSLNFVLLLVVPTAKFMKFIKRVITLIIITVIRHRWPIAGLIFYKDLSPSLVGGAQLHQQRAEPSKHGVHCVV